MKCKTIEFDFQPYPLRGSLVNNLNPQLETLVQRIGTEQATVYCYVISTIRNKNGCFVQRGSAPNFQGGMITLCTCKHYMRSFLDTSGWKGKWIAGFTGIEAGGGRNALVYLMKIGHVFESHYDFWVSKAISAKTKRAKAASRDKLGDIFRPKDDAGDPFDPKWYYSPVDKHVHAPGNKYFEDIDYVGCAGRRPSLLAGDPNYSFLWNKPMIFYRLQIPRGQKKCELSKLVGHSRKGLLVRP